MKVWREGTTTSPSGRHLGHYKSMFTVIDKSLKATERKELKEIQERIAGCYVATTNYAIRHNYSYKKWKKILNFMKYKEKGNVKIHRLRVIHIYEVDYNFFIRNSMERSDTTRPAIRRDQPRTVSRMSRKGLHIGYVPRRIEKRYFVIDKNCIFKL